MLKCWFYSEAQHHSIQAGMNQASYQDNEVETFLHIIILHLQRIEVCIVFDVVMICLDSLYEHSYKESYMQD
jgi:hypothetical protein